MCNNLEISKSTQDHYMCQALLIMNWAFLLEINGKYSKIKFTLCCFWINAYWNILYISSYSPFCDNEHPIRKKIYGNAKNTRKTHIDSSLIYRVFIAINVIRIVIRISELLLVLSNVVVVKPNIITFTARKERENKYLNYQS